MKNKIIILCVIVLLLLSACTEVSKSCKNTGDIRYSNLYTKESQEEVKSFMRSLTLKEENIQRYFANINHYNYIIRGHTLVKEDFIGFKGYPRLYDLEIIRSRWKSSHPDFIGMNSRITTYDFLKDYIRILNNERGSDQAILFDKEALKNAPNNIFTSQEQAGFETFYSTIPTENTKEVDIHQEKIKDFYQEKQITMKMPPGVSLISVYLHSKAEDGQDLLSVGHTGILLHKDESYVFLEKLSFEEPYQVTLFQCKKQLENYLMKKFDLSSNQPIAKPIIFENTKIMENEE